MKALVSLRLCGVTGETIFLLRLWLAAAFFEVAFPGLDFFGVTALVAPALWEGFGATFEALFRVVLDFMCCVAPSITGIAAEIVSIATMLHAIVLLAFVQPTVALT